MPYIFPTEKHPALRLPGTTGRGLRPSLACSEGLNEYEQKANLIQDVLRLLRSQENFKLSQEALEKAIESKFSPSIRLLSEAYNSTDNALNEGIINYALQHSHRFKLDDVKYVMNAVVKTGGIISEASLIPVIEFNDSEVNNQLLSPILANIDKTKGKLSGNSLKAAIDSKNITASEKVKKALIKNNFPADESLVKYACESLDPKKARDTYILADVIETVNETPGGKIQQPLINVIQEARSFHWRDIIDQLLEKARQLLNLTDSNTNSNSPRF